MVPNGWEKHPVGKICRSIVPGRNKPKEFSGSIPWVTTPEVKGRYIPSKVQQNYVSTEALRECGGKIVPSGAVVMAAVGELGLVAIASEEVVLNQQLHAFVCSDSVHNEYLAYWLSSQKPYMETIASKTTIPYLNKTNCESIPVALPPLHEQRKIAKILSTWDKAIRTTERLIDNSKQQKKALMQQLLTGAHTQRKRLLDDSGKPFEGEWEEVKLGEISHITTGSSNREDSSLDGEYTFFDRSEDIRTSSRYLFDSEAVIVPGEGQDFVPKHFEGKFDLHQRTYAIMNFDGCVGRFLFYYIGYHRHYFLAQAVGSTVKSLRLPMFQKMPINLPNQLEQAKIASVLNNADREIKILQQQLADLKQEKKALMQQLLTGKRRVKI